MDLQPVRLDDDLVNQRSQEFASTVGVEFGEAPQSLAAELPDGTLLSALGIMGDLPRPSLGQAFTGQWRR